MLYIVDFICSKSTDIYSIKYSLTPATESQNHACGMFHQISFLCAFLASILCWKERFSVDQCSLANLVMGFMGILDNIQEDGER